MVKKFLWWLPFAITITGLCGIAYFLVQQNYRLSANDPQIQLAEDLSSRLDAQKSIDSLRQMESVEISKSLASFYMILNHDGSGSFTTGRLDGKYPEVPDGLAKQADNKDYYAITWQPRPDVRIAAVITKFSGGYVLVGRSLKEVEQREHMALLATAAAWAVLLVATFVAVLLIPQKKK